MRYLLLLVLAGAIGTLGCRLPGQEAETGFEFRIHKPPLLFARTPLLVNQGCQHAEMQAVQSMVGPVDSFSASRFAPIPTLPMPLASPRLPCEVPAPPAALAAPPTRLTLDEWIRLQDFMAPKKMNGNQ